MKNKKILESLTQGKENLNAILGSKIHFNKEGLRYLLKIKKKYDVRTINFVPQQKSEINPLIKMKKYLEESNVSKEKFEVVKNVNIELQNNAEKLQKELDEKQKILKSLTQG